MIKKNYKKIILLSAAAIAGTTFTIPVLPILNVTAETVVEEDSYETTIVDKITDVSKDYVTDNESYSIDENITLPTGDSLLTEDSEIKDSDEALSDIQKDAQDSYDSNYDESENSTEEYKNFSGVGASNATNKANEIKAKIKNGWIREDGGYKYYKNGKAYTGWHMMGSAEGEKTAHWSYFGADGKIYTGWHYMSKSEGEKTAHWSFFGDNGWLRTGWVQFGKGTSNPDGNSAKHWSFFGDNGWLRTGWVQFGKGTSNPDGNSAKHWSFFGDNGWLRTGWVQLGKGTSNPDGNSAKHWSYFGDNGWLRTGWVQLGKGTSNPDGNAAKHWSYFGSNGWLRTEWVQFGRGTSEPDGNSAKHWSYFGPNGWLRTGWQDMGKGTSNPDGNSAKHRSYFGDNGWLRTGTQVIDGKKYRFDNRGWLNYSYAAITPKEDPEEVWAGIHKIEVRFKNGMHIYLPSFREDFKEGNHYTYIGYGYTTGWYDPPLEYYKVIREDQVTDRIYYGKDYFDVDSYSLHIYTQDQFMSLFSFDGEYDPGEDILNVENPYVYNSENSNIYRRIGKKGGKYYYVDFSVSDPYDRTWSEGGLDYYIKYADKIVKSAWVE